MNHYPPDKLALLTDFYELTMIQGYYLYQKNPDVVFDMFFRREPFHGGYALFAGLEPLIKAVLSLRFEDEDIRYLEKLKIFKPSFLRFLSGFKFTGDIYSVEEGEVVFAKEPLIRVHANLIEAQLLESLLLNTINFQTLIATKSARIAEVSRGRAIFEFGLRRAQGMDGAVSAVRAAYIGGAEGTSNVYAGKLFNIPVRGTMAHSWIMAFGSEKAAFRKYADLYPQNTILLVDTYDTLKTGLPAAIKTFQYLKRKGVRNFGLRLDSGDLEYLSKQARMMLDRANLKEARIVVSNELDEYIIEQLMNKKAPIDFFGVGTNLVTAKDDPALTGVYKLVAKKEKKKYQPIIKITNNPEKTTNPHIKNVLRLFDKDRSMCGDLIFLEGEIKGIMRRSGQREPLVFFHPEYDYSSVILKGYRETKVLLRTIVKHGRLVYGFPNLAKIQKKAAQNLRRLDPSYKRLLNPHLYKVSITRRIRDMKLKLIKELV